MKRRITDGELRELLVRRMTKGAAFIRVDYEARLAEVRAEVERMSRTEMMAKWPEYTYDVK